MARVTKDTTIGEVIQIDAGVIPILMGAGMHCVGCPSSAGETLEEAAMVHGIDSDMLVEEIQSGAFPAEEHSYKIDDEVIEKLYF